MGGIAGGGDTIDVRAGGEELAGDAVFEGQLGAVNSDMGRGRRYFRWGVAAPAADCGASRVST